MPSCSKTINLHLDIEGILDFNRDLGMSGNWGYYDNPFDAIQFFGVTDEKGTPLTMPVLPRDCEVTLNIQFPAVSGYTVEVDHIRLNLIGEREFSKITPRDSWKTVLDLVNTDGAIGAEGNYFLGEVTESATNDIFKLITYENLQDSSYNVTYSIKFSIQNIDGVKYCKVDPLMRTSGEDEVGL